MIFVVCPARENITYAPSALNVTESAETVVEETFEPSAFACGEYFTVYKLNERAPCFCFASRLKCLLVLLL